MQKFCYSRQNKKETTIDFLVRRFPYQDKKGWLQCIRTGEIKVNDGIVSPDIVLRNKDIVSYERPRQKEPAIDDDYETLYLDDYITLINKNGNIPVSESGRYHLNNLINILKEREGYSELYAVHRLDRETSGVVLIARTKKIATKLGEQFSNQVPQKTYYAVLVGEVDSSRILVDKPIGKNVNGQGSVRIRQVIDPKGKSAKTLFTIQKVAKGLTLAKIRMFSGRTHQIRCHAEYIGCPILGDKLYGQTDKFFLELLKGNSDPVFPPFGRINRQLLHAHSLSFIHPVTNRWVTFQADYRKEFCIFSSLKELLVEKTST